MFQLVSSGVLSLDALSLHLLLFFILNAAALAFLLQCFDLLFVVIPLLDPVDPLDPVAPVDPVISAGWHQRMVRTNPKV